MTDCRFVGRECKVSEIPTNETCDLCLRAQELARSPYPERRDICPHINAGVPVPCEPLGPNCQLTKGEFCSKTEGSVLWQAEYLLAEKSLHDAKVELIEAKKAGADIGGASAQVRMAMAALADRTPGEELNKIKIANRHLQQARKLIAESKCQK